MTSRWRPLPARMRTLLTVVIFVTPLLVAPLTAAAEGATTAAGVLVVEGSSISSALVRVPEDARLSLDYFDRSKATGPRFSAGRDLAAVTLVNVDRSNALHALTAVRLPKAPAQVQRLVSIGPDNCMLDAEGCPVEAGLYRLILVTETHVRVELRFDGLSGRRIVRPATPVAGGVEAPAPEYSYDVPYTATGLNAVGAGFAPETTGRAIVFSAFWFSGAEEGIGPVAPADEPLLQVGAAGACAYFGRPPDTGAFAPGCPQGSEVGTFLTQRALDDFEFLQWNQLSGLPPGTYGLGNYAVHTGIFDPGFIGFWLDAS